MCILVSCTTGPKLFLYISLRALSHTVMCLNTRFSMAVNDSYIATRAPAAFYEVLHVVGFPRATCAGWPLSAIHTSRPCNSHFEFPPSLGSLPLPKMLRIRIYTVTTGLYIVLGSHRGACQVIVCRPVSAHGSELDLFVTYNTPDVQILQPAQFVSSVLCIAFTHSWHCRKIGFSSATSTTTLPPCLNSVCFQCPLLKLRQGVVGGCPH